MYTDELEKDWPSKERKDDHLQALRTLVALVSEDGRIGNPLFPEEAKPGNRLFSKGRLPI